MRIFVQAKNEAKISAKIGLQYIQLTTMRLYIYGPFRTNFEDTYIL